MRRFLGKNGLVHHATRVYRIGGYSRYEALCEAEIRRASGPEDDESTCMTCIILLAERRLRWSDDEEPN